MASVGVSWMPPGTRKTWLNLQLCQIEDPDTLWVREGPSDRPSEERLAFLRLEEQMNAHFRKAARPHTLLSLPPRLRDVVAVLFRERWCRGRVEDVYAPSGADREASVKVFLLDYGIVVKVMSASVVDLGVGEWSSVPYQARRITLFGLVPFSLSYTCTPTDFKLVLKEVQKWDTTAVEFVAKICQLRPSAEFQPIAVGPDGCLQGFLSITFTKDHQKHLPKISLSGYSKEDKDAAAVLVLDLAGLLVHCGYSSWDKEAMVKLLKQVDEEEEMKQAEGEGRRLVKQVEKKEKEERLGEILRRLKESRGMFPDQDEGQGSKREEGCLRGKGTDGTGSCSDENSEDGDRNSCIEEVKYGSGDDIFSKQLASLPHDQDFSLPSRRSEDQNTPTGRESKLGQGTELTELLALSPCRHFTPLPSPLPHPSVPSSQMSLTSDSLPLYSCGSAWNSILRSPTRHTYSHSPEKNNCSILNLEGNPSQTSTSKSLASPLVKVPAEMSSTPLHNIAKLEEKKTMQDENSAEKAEKIKSTQLQNSSLVLKKDKSVNRKNNMASLKTKISYTSHEVHVTQKPASLQTRTLETPPEDSHKASSLQTEISDTTPEVQDSPFSGMTSSARSPVYSKFALLPSFSEYRRIRMSELNIVETTGSNNSQALSHDELRGESRKLVKDSVTMENVGKLGENSREVSKKESDHMARISGGIFAGGASERKFISHGEEEHKRLRDQKAQQSGKKYSMFNYSVGRNPQALNKEYSSTVKHTDDFAINHKDFGSKKKHKAYPTAYPPWLSKGLLHTTQNFSSPPRKAKQLQTDTPLDDKDSLIKRQNKLRSKQSTGETPLVVNKEEDIEALNRCSEKLDMAGKVGSSCQALNMFMSDTRDIWTNDEVGHLEEWAFVPIMSLQPKPPNIAKLFRVFVSGVTRIAEEDVMVNEHVSVAQLNPHIVEALRNSEMRATRLQAFSWPVLARGSSAIIVGGHSCGKTLGYVVPLLSTFLDTWQHMRKRLLPGVGAALVVVCGSWHSAKTVADYMVNFLPTNVTLRIMTAWGGCGREEMEETRKLLMGGCDILITTAPCLVRLLTGEEPGTKAKDPLIESPSTPITSLSRCCHLVIDDIDLTLEQFPNEVKQILIAWGEGRRKGKRGDLEQQVVLVGSHWTQLFDSLAHMLLPLMDPTVIISSPVEAAVAAKVTTHAHYAASEGEFFMKVVALIKSFYSNRKNLVFVSSKSASEKLMALLQNATVYCFRMSCSTVRWKLEHIVREWHMVRGVTLVVCKGAEQFLLQHDLANADTIFQCYISQPVSSFALKYAFLIDNLSTDLNQKTSDCESHVLVSPAVLDAAPSIIEELQRICISLPPEFTQLAASVDQRNHGKYKALCYYLKAYGRCPIKSSCKFRHHVQTSDIPSGLPRSGEVTFEVISVLNASRFLVRLTEFREKAGAPRRSLRNNYLTLFLALQEHCANPTRRKSLGNVELGTYCAVETEEGFWARGQVVKVSYAQKCPMLVVFLVDEGREITVEQKSAYALPPTLAAVPELIVEVYLCCVKPLDLDREWTFQASRFMQDIFTANKSSIFVGRIVLALGLTLWLRPVVEFTKVGKKFVKKETLRSRLIMQGFGVDNPRHIENLKELCTQASVPLKPESLSEHNWKSEIDDALTKIKSMEAKGKCNSSSGITLKNNECIEINVDIVDQTEKCEDSDIQENVDSTGLAPQRQEGSDLGENKKSVCQNSISGKVGKDASSNIEKYNSSIKSTKTSENSTTVKRNSSSNRTENSEDSIYNKSDTGNDTQIPKAQERDTEAPGSKGPKNDTDSLINKRNLDLADNATDHGILWEELPLLMDVRVMLGEVESAERFFVIREDRVARLDALEKKIETYSEYLHSVETIGMDIVFLDQTFPPGSPCLAKFSDDHYYRGLVLEVEVEGDKSRVFFIDHGETLTLPHSQVQASPVSLVNQLPGQAIQCRLAHITVPPGQHQDATSLMRELANLTPVWNLKAVKVIEGLAGRREYVVELTADSHPPKHMWKQLIEAGVALPLTKEEESPRSKSSTPPLDPLNASLIHGKEAADFIMNFPELRAQIERVWNTHHQQPDHELDDVNRSMSKEDISACSGSDLRVNSSANSHLRHSKSNSTNSGASKCVSEIKCVTSEKNIDGEEKMNMFHIEKSSCVHFGSGKNACTPPQKVSSSKEENLEPGSSWTSNSQNDRRPKRPTELSTSSAWFRKACLLVPALEAVENVTPRLNPETSWYQSQSDVTVTLHLVGVKEYKCRIAMSRLTFMTMIGDKFYVLDEALAGTVDVDHCFTQIGGTCVTITLRKAPPVQWHHLVGSGGRRAWLRRVIHSVSSDEDQTPNSEQEVTWRHDADRDEAVMGGLPAGISDTDLSSDGCTEDEEFIS